MTDYVFISDLHLIPDTPSGSSDAGHLFSKFAHDVAANADHLYILGDFLEVWWGDDAPNGGYQALADTLEWLATEANTKIHIMHGNRDFMMGSQLAERWHFTLLDDIENLSLNGLNVVLMHGDTLCTDDIEYQKFRAMVRNPEWQKQVMQKTLEERFALAKQIREASKEQMSNKAEDIMDVNSDEVNRVFAETQADIIIHGHTHRPAIHDLSINDKTVKRIVLGDWHKSAQYLHLSSNKPVLELSSITI